MASPDTQPKVEEITDDKENQETNAEDEPMPDLEPQPKEERKMTKNEKKCKKQLGKIGFRPQTGITRVTLKRRDGIIFVINNPEAFISPNSESLFVVLGELKMDEPRVDNLPQPAPKAPAAAKPAETAETEAKPEGELKEEDKGEASKVEEVPDADDDDEPSEEGLTPMHIDMVMQNANCSRAEAVKALRETNNDMVNAIMHLSK